MSAAAQFPPRYPSAIRAACFTPLSFFHRNLDLPYTQLRSLALIIVETLGHNRLWAEISDEKFTEYLRVSKEHVLNSLCWLEEAKMIRVNRSDRGRPTYALAEEYIEERKKAGRQTVRGKCPNCQAIGEFSTEFIPTPHQALRKLGGCVSSAVYRVVMVVIRHTLKWGRESHLIEIEPSELALDDFTRLTGLESREITSGLTEAVKLGLIGRQLRSGRPSLFWAIPEKFGELERRALRVVHQPSRSGETRAKKVTPEKEEKPKNLPEEPAIESRPYLYGRCQNCNHLVAVEPVTEEEFAASVAPKPPERPPRSGPPPKSKQKSRSEKMWDKLKQWHSGSSA